jgi:mRNA interferase MazF
VIERGGIYWADLGAPVGSRPAKRRPVVVISAQTYNQSRLATVVALVITSNTELAAMPGNVFLPAAATGLPRDSVVNVTASVTLNKTDLTEQAGLTPLAPLREIDRALRSSLDL